ncbi:hypothetical protein GF373_07160, partial [bacterium]|nr:hypothetical protein [bacterium]
MTSRILLIVLQILVFTPVSQSQSDPFQVLNPYHGMTSKRMVWMEYTDARNALYHYLKDMGQEKFKKRAEKIASIQSLSEWKIRQDEVHTILHS